MLVWPGATLLCALTPILSVFLSSPGERGPGAVPWFLLEGALWVPPGWWHLGVSLAVLTWRAAALAPPLLRGLSFCRTTWRL